MTEFQNPQGRPAGPDTPEPTPSSAEAPSAESAPDAPHPAAPTSAAPTSAAPVTPAQAPAFSGPGAEPITRPQPAVPAAPHAPTMPIWPSDHQAGWAPGTQYAAPGTHTAPPPYSGAGFPPPQSGAGFPPPPWAPQQPAPGGTHRRSGRAGKVLALGVAALVLMLGSGLVGGWVATSMEDTPTTAGLQSRPASNAPVVDRSSLAQIAAAVEPSVVSISTGNGEGSGVVLTDDGYVLTNNHVVASAQGGTVSVVFSNGKSAQAKIVGTDPLTDLAVVQASGVANLVPAKFGDSSAMQVGDTVLALGSPLGLQGSVTAGIVSALNRTIQTGGEQRSPLEPPTTGRSMSGLLQTDAPINPGNSGGALVNTSAEVIGINTAIATSGQSQGNIGVGFAIPSNKAKAVADQLMKGEKVSHPFLGVNVADVEGAAGALIGSVQPGSPAEKAGLQKGDIVTKIGEKAINDSDDLVSAVQTGKVGDRLTVTYVRNGDQRTTTVTLGEAS